MIIHTILIGLAAGAAAKYISPGEDPGNFDDAQGVAITIIIGIVGSVIGGLIGKIIWVPIISGFVEELFLATLGAIIFLWGYKKYKENQGEAV